MEAGVPPCLQPTPQAARSYATPRAGVGEGPITKILPPATPRGGGLITLNPASQAVAYPESLSPLEVQRLLRRSKNRRIGLNGVQAHLELYSGFGKLVKVGERYRASGLVMGGIDPEAQDRIKKVAKRLRRLSPLCQAYVRGDQGAIFGQLVGQMDMGCASDAADEIQVAVEAIILRHAERSRLLEASGEAQLVNYSGLILFSQTREEKA